MKHLDKLLDRILKNTGKQFGIFDKFLYGAIISYFIDNLLPNSEGKITIDTKNAGAIVRMPNEVQQNMQGPLKVLYETIIGGIVSFFSKGIKGLLKFDVSAIEKSNETLQKLRDQSSTTAKTVINLEQVFADVKQRSIALMSRPGGISLKELRKELETVIVDKKIMSRYYGRWTHDIYSQYQRIATNEVRKKLGLRFAIYQGGLIEASRDFCEERNGKVFHEDEISSWANLDWEGKPEVGYNPIADLGGYNCRHRLDWISDELAFRLRPELRQKYEQKAA